METNLQPAIIITLAFFAITFIQSGYDKINDWKGNLGWLKGHFANTIIKNMVPQSLGLILVLEAFSGAFSVIGIIKLLMGEGTDFAFIAGVLNAVTLLFLLLGQRMAKDYDGARTIVIYFIPAILLLTWV
jgi:uncharacterized membrane protein YphA (DoxX/SURF4 family)